MRFFLLANLSVFFGSCDCPSTKQGHLVPEGGGDQSVVFQFPADGDAAMRLLWQRCFPEEYLDLIEYARETRDPGIPFVDPIEIPDSELTPDNVTGITGYGRGIVPRAFVKMGYPLEGNATAFLSYDTGLFEITHSPAAIKAFRKLFPDVPEIKKRK